MNCIVHIKGNDDFTANRTQQPIFLRKMQTFGNHIICRCLFLFHGFCFRRFFQFRFRQNFHFRRARYSFRNHQSILKQVFLGHSRQLYLSGTHFHGGIVQVIIQIQHFIQGSGITVFPQANVILHNTICLIFFCLVILGNLLEFVRCIVLQRHKVYGVTVVRFLHLIRLHINPRHCKCRKHKCGRGNHNNTFLFGIIPSVSSHTCHPFLYKITYKPNCFF